MSRNARSFRVVRAVHNCLGRDINISAEITNIDPLDKHRPVPDQSCRREIRCNKCRARRLHPRPQVPRKTHVHRFPQAGPCRKPEGMDTIDIKIRILKRQ